jgi:deoxyribonuclease-1-like protein
VRRPQLAIAAVVVCGGAWLFFQHYRIAGLDHLELTPRGAAGGLGQPDDLAPPPIERSRGTVRIASFNIQAFGPAKLASPRVMNVLAEAVARFDIVAIQEIQSKTDDILPHFVDAINASGRHYDFVIGPRLGTANGGEQYAYIFDSASIEIDRSALYTVQDPDDLVEREPLVAWFRVRGPPANQAFTFTLIDMRAAADHTQTELDAAAGVYRAVRDDGRGEDDVILLGDLNADDHHLGRLTEISHMLCVISGLPTNTRSDKQLDNILFSKAATVEFTGRSGVFDLIREFNLTTDEALQISDHMPVWAEFSIYEGGQGGRMAARRRTAAAR